jgi:gluconolactonase
MGMNRRRFFAASSALATLAALPRALAEWQPSQRYPDPLIKIIDPSFAQYRLPLAKVERIASGMRWCEGPVWIGDGRYLLWSDIPNNRIMKWEEETGAVSVPQTLQQRERQHATGRGVAHSRRSTRQRTDIRQHHRDRRPARRQAAQFAERHCVQVRRLIWLTDPPFGILAFEGHVAKVELPTKRCIADPNPQVSWLVM